jgi:diguanylate cyclase (GGDEF)-like protein/PAS domain S-box-containing protein
MSYSFDDHSIPPHSIRALIVEDEPLCLEATRLLIGQHFTAVDAAETGAAAQARLENQVYDVVFLDLMLPDTSGHEIMQFIRLRHPDTLIIVVSGDSSIEAAIKSLRGGAYDYLRKPYRPEELIKSVRNAVQKLKLRHDNLHYQHRLQQSEQLHRLLVNLSPDLIYTLDTEGRFTYLNDSIGTMLGYAAGELIGQHYSRIVHNEDLELARYRVNERRREGRATRDLELRFQRKADSAGGNGGLSHIVAELSSMGLYRPRPDGREEFIGSYGVARDISARKQAEATINFQAYHDQLTSLPNRALFRDRLNQALAQAKRQNGLLAVMFLDLDRFKNINDTLGHLIGDSLLQAVGQRIRACLREGDTLARVGGDEFMLLLPSIRARDNAALIASKIQQALKAPFSIEGHELFVTMSIGIAVYPDDGDSMETLTKHADIALYHTKDKGRDGYHFFLHDLNTHLNGRMTIETDLRRGLQREEFEVFYQPQYEVVSRRIIGMEALVRWRHPEKGMIAPGEFIPIAEDTGLIAPLSEQVLQHVCRQARLWHELGLPRVSVAVNLSAKQIEHPEFVERFMATLLTHRVPAGAIGIEITESMLMRDLEGAIGKLKQLSKLGIEISIDDFGTGYSSLSYLNRLPVDTIKIDKSFVQDIRPSDSGTSIVAGIAAMTRGLNLNLIAEGVETAAQFEYLERIGCHACQGYYLSHPLDASTATQVLGAQAL